MGVVSRSIAPPMYLVLGSRHQVCSPARHFEHAQCHDEGGERPPRDEHAVDRATDSADHERRADRCRDRKLPVANRDAEDGARQRENRSDRQVDASGNDDQRHAARHQEDVGKLVGDRPQRRGGEEVIGCGAKPCDEGDEDAGEACVLGDQPARARRSSGSRGGCGSRTGRRIRRRAQCRVSRVIRSTGVSRFAGVVVLFRSISSAYSIP